MSYCMVSGIGILSSFNQRFRLAFHSLYLSILVSHTYGCI